MSTGLILVGEPMGLLIAQSEGTLEKVNGYSLTTAGAELNVAIGTARLGHKVTYMTKLGNDPFGKYVMDTIKKNHIGVEFITTSEERTTGFMLKSRVNEGDPDIFYFRKNSAASTLSAQDVDKLDFSEYSNLHLTGILPALSESTTQASFHLIEKARQYGLTISFDPNLRPQLWSSQVVMRETINKLASLADIVLPGTNEGKILMGSSDPSTINKFYRENGAKTVITKCGSNGAYATTEQAEFMVPGFKVEKIVDTVGAGDGFAAGTITALMEGLPLEKAIERGNAIGAIQVMHRSDNEGLPNQQQLQDFYQQS